MKILSFIPLKYSKSGAFWGRDLGLVTLGLRALGKDAWFVTLSGESPEEGKPLLTPTVSQASDPGWWKSQKPDAVILNTWGVPRYDKIRQAVCLLGCPVIEKLDTDGVKSPRIYPVHSLRRSLVDYDHRSYYPGGLRSQIYGLMKFFISLALPSTLDKRLVRCMEQVSMFAAETPLGAERVRRFLELYSANPMPKVFHIPHPVDTRLMTFEGAKEKLNCVVAVGRWHDAVKGWPLLEALSRRFLARNPLWKIVVIGPGSDALGTTLQKEFSERFRGLGYLSHAEVSKFYQNSKIYLLTSHSETFNIAGAEAVCCGCSFVGPTQIPSSAYFAGANSGTVSHVRSVSHMLDALNTEAGEWARGRRNPVEISSFWKKELGHQEIANQFLNHLSASR